MTTNFAEHDTTTDGASLAAEPKQDTYPYLLHGVDPRTLRTDGNSRVVGDIRQHRPKLVSSVAEHGVNPMVSMINVAPDDEGFTVLVGFHRTAAAVAVAERENLGLTIDVLVHAPGTTRQEVLVAQGIENLHREGYTQAEEAGLYEQLALAGLDDDTIAQTLTRPVERVTAGRAVAATSRTRAAASDQLPDTDLLVLGQLAEFADDEAAHNELVDVLTRFPGNFDWKLGLLRRRRAQQAKRAEEVQHLTDQGHVVVDEDDIPETGAHLDELCTGEGQALDPATHADCPGHAVSVYVDSSHEVKLTEFCTDFVAHGHHTITSALVAAAEEQLRTDGVPVVEPGVEGQAKLRDLLADEHAHQPLTAEQHADCPGHAAYTQIMHGWASADVHYVCTDYAAHGHVLHTVVISRPEPDAAYQAAERKRAGVNNKAWREAKAARREWLITLFTGWRKRKTADLPARVHHWLALAPVLAADYLEEAAPAHHYACTLLKLGEPQDYQRDHNPIALHLRKKTATENQAVLIRLAQVIGACEEHWNRVYTEQADSSWRRPADAACFYFELLEALGYPLSHVEQLVNNPDLDNETWPHSALTPARSPNSTTPINRRDQPSLAGAAAVGHRAVAALASAVGVVAQLSLAVT